MINIELSNAVVRFQSSVCGLVESEITELEYVQQDSFHMGTNIGIFLINIQQFSINSIIFEDANEAINYINSL